MFHNTAAGGWIGAIVGCVGGYFAVKYVKPVVIIVTAAVNGLCAGLLLSLVNPALGVIAAFICIFGGFYFQCVTNGYVFGIGTEKMNFGNSFKNNLNESGPGFVDLPAAAGTGEPSHNSKTTTEQSAAFMKNSKLRSQLTAALIRTHNDREFFFKNSPIVLPQIQIADIDMEGNIGLYFSIQNITRDKRVVAVYFDIQCYNILKEKLAELKEVPILDLTIQSGEVVKLEKAISLPDFSIRRCELIPRHVVFSDDQIWNYEGDEAFVMAPRQEELTFSRQELAGEFKKALENRTELQAEKLTWRPTDFGDFWYCGCGQLNTASVCVCCGIDKAAMFEAADESHLEELYKETLAEKARERAEQERLEEERRQKKAEMDAERKRKLAELQSRTVSVLGAAAEKGRETIHKAGSVSQQALDSLKKQGAERSAKDGEENPMTIRCPKCLAACPQGDKFCKKCGTALRTEGKLCKSCGCVNDSDSMFCMSCGAALSDSEEDK